jgi:hypothetical protein
MAASGTTPKEDEPPSCVKKVLRVLTQELRREQFREKAQGIWKRINAPNLKDSIKFGKKAVYWLPKQQAKYWTDVWNSKGTRLIRVARENPETFNKSVLLNPFGYPVTLLPEIFKTNYTASAPLTFVASLAGLILFYEQNDNSIMSQVTTTQTKVPGADYAVSLFNQHMIATRSKLKSAISASTEPLELRDTISQHERNILKWLEPSGSWQDLERIRQLRKLEILKNDFDAQALSDLAKTVVQKVAKSSSEEDFTRRLEDEWNSTLKEADFFKKRPKSDLMLFSLLFTPAVTVTLKHGSPFGSTYSDFELLEKIYGGRDPRLAPLSVLSDGTDPVSLLRMGIEMIEDPELVQKKQKQWQSFAGTGSTRSTPSFIRRPDFPAFARANLSFDSDGDGASPIPFDSELDIWKLIWDDRRFLDIKSTFNEGNLSELEALRLGIERTVSYNEIFKTVRSNVEQDDNEVCSLIGLGKSSQPNRLLSANVTVNADFIAKTRKLSNTQQVSCAVELARFYISYFHREAGVFSNQLKYDRFIMDGKAELTEITKSCPKREHQCSK